MRLKPIIYRLFFCFSLLFCAAPAQAVEATLAIRVAGEVETLTLQWAGSGKSKIFQLDNPPRLVIDLPALRSPGDLRLPGDYKGRLIRNFRSGWFDPQTTRLVFELAAKPARVESSLRSAGGKTTITVTLAASATAAKKAEPAKAPAPEPKKPEKPEKPLIVIDAGHGGQDPGAIGPGGTHEKDVVLGFAQAFKQALLDTGRYRVKLTRDDDHFILLRDRIAIARKAGGDLFISLHADSADDDAARGLSIYTLSEKASDAEAEALAARENRADVLSGMDLSTQDQDVADILISLAQRDTNLHSVQLAELLVRGVSASGVRLLQNSHRFAGFAVLKAPDIPSVLVETGFVSHPEEEKLLTTRTHRQRVVKGLVAGVDGYFKGLGTGR